VVLFTCFRWSANAWLVLDNVPFSLIGGILATAVTGIGLTLGALVGLVTVFGASARNSILLLAHYEHLVLNEGLPWDLTTTLRGAQERLTPIVTTAAVTALGLLPLALAIAKPGQEIEGPMAIYSTWRITIIDTAEPDLAPRPCADRPAISGVYLTITGWGTTSWSPSMRQLESTS
jgi:Cu/Ag efflux pump CusA